MRDTTRQHLCNEITELAGVRGAVTWHDADYLRNKINEAEERLTEIQNKMHEATWSEETQWMDE